VSAIARMFDDPIAAVRASFSPEVSSGVRRLTLEVVDRNEARYAPKSFTDLPRQRGGRWLVVWYLASSEFGTMLSPGITYIRGAERGTVGSLFISQTDDAGYVEVEITKADPGDVWAHALAIGPLRSKGIDWTTGEVYKD